MQGYSKDGEVTLSSQLGDMGNSLSDNSTNSRLWWSALSCREVEVGWSEDGSEGSTGETHPLLQGFDSVSQVVEDQVAADEPGEQVAAGGATSRQQAHEGKAIPHSKQSPS